MTRDDTSRVASFAARRDNAGRPTTDMKRRRTSHPLLFARCTACIAAVLALGGCASGGVVDKGLELVGLKKPEPPAALEGVELPKVAAPRKVTLRIHAGQVLNTDPSGRALSVITRIYSLRGTTQFDQATYAMFAASGSERPPYQDDVVAMREVVLAPGQKYEVVETLAKETTHLAVVALFRSPDSQRWRFVFEAKPASASGITLGAHACALSVAEGAPLGVAPEATRLAGVQCR